MTESKNIDVLIVDDEELICFVLTHLLKVHGYSSRTANRGDRALKMIEDQRPDLIIMDIRMPGMSGFDVLARVREFDTKVPVILMTALPGIRDAVLAMKATAFDYIAKPFNNDDMIATVGRALSVAADLQSGERGTDTAHEPLHPLFASMGSSLAVRRLAREAGRVAQSAAPVMIIGEIGSGKRHLGKILHALSGRRGSFVEIDCTGASELMLRREFFGTPIGKGTVGKIELAKEGSLLLDEVSEIPWTFQDVLAEAFHERQFLTAATEEVIPMTARLLCTASSGDERGIDGNHLTRRFRELYGDAILEMPPLRERHEDIPTLALEFLKNANEELGRNLTVISDPALETLLSYDWPGNVHQLKSTIRHAVLTSKDAIGIDDIDLPVAFDDIDPAKNPQIGVAAAPLKEQVRRHIAEVERQLVFDTLRHTGWNKAQAARLLGVTYKTLLKKVSDYGLERQ